MSQWWTEERRKQLRELFRDGMSYRGMADELGTTTKAVWHACVREELPRRKPKQRPPLPSDKEEKVAQMRNVSACDTLLDRLIKYHGKGASL